jgi:hypothetical protein
LRVNEGKGLGRAIFKLKNGRTKEHVTRIPERSGIGTQLTADHPEPFQGLDCNRAGSRPLARTADRFQQAIGKINTLPF